MLLSPEADKGLSEPDSGNSKIGYLHIGAGRELPREMSASGFANTFGEYISSLGLEQTRIYGSTDSIGPTYYFSGKNEKPFPGEKRISIAAESDISPKEMLFDITQKISEATVKEIESGKSDVIIASVSICETARNGGDAGFISKAYAAANLSVGKIINVTKENGGIAFITSTNSCTEGGIGRNAPETAKNLVPFIVVGANVCLKPGRLSDIAPTILDIMGLSQPEEMTGKSLIVNC